MFVLLDEYIVLPDTDIKDVEEVGTKVPVLIEEENNKDQMVYA